jgi:hypothetical protein
MSPLSASGLYSWLADPGDPGGGIPGVFVFFFVLAGLAAIGTTVWKVTTAQKLAKRSGMDSSLATQMTLLSDDGLDATYLAASLRQSPATSAVPAPGRGADAVQVESTAERLRELKSLLDQGLVTPTEYDERRKSILDAV